MGTGSQPLQAEVEVEQVQSEPHSESLSQDKQNPMILLDTCGAAPTCGEEEVSLGG